MKKKSIYLVVTIFLILSILLFKTKDEIIFFIINLDFTSTQLKTFFIFLTLIYFLTPLPITIIILLNGYLFNEYGFFLSMLQISIGSLILKLLSYRINEILKINLRYKKINFKKLSANNYSIFISRLIIPYFIHNIYYGLINVGLKKFFLIIFFAEIPMTYALNQIGSSIAKISSDLNLSFYSLITDINFYIPFFIIFVVFIIANYLYKKNT